MVLRQPSKVMNCGRGPASVVVEVVEVEVVEVEVVEVVDDVALVDVDDLGPEVDDVALVEVDDVPDVCVRPEPPDAVPVVPLVVPLVASPVEDCVAG